MLLDYPYLIKLKEEEDEEVKYGDICIENAILVKPKISEKNYINIVEKKSSESND